MQNIPPQGNFLNVRASFLPELEVGAVMALVVYAVDIHAGMVSQTDFLLSRTMVLRV